MTQYAIYFMQQWVGDHPEEWYQTRVEPSRAVVHDMQEAGVLVFAGGLVEDMELPSAPTAPAATWSSATAPTPR